jgi:hypothetical protein
LGICKTEVSEETKQPGRVTPLSAWRKEQATERTLFLAVATRAAASAAPVVRRVLLERCLLSWLGISS